MTSLRGVECRPCRRRGHFCPAALWAPRINAEGEDPMCRECADSEPCIRDRVGGSVRDGSCVKADLNIFGEAEFAATAGEVITRTPEDLGLDRVIYAPTPRPQPKIEAAAYIRRPQPKSETARRPVPTIKAPKPPIPENTEMENVNKTPQPIREAIIAAGFTMPAHKLAELHKISPSTVFAIRAEAGLKKHGVHGPEGPAAPKPAAKKATAKPPALAPIIAGAASITLDISIPIDIAKADAVWKKLSLAEKGVAITAVLKAQLGM